HSSSCVLFFFKRPAHHRDLHSFPTRRSSDLRAAPRRLHLPAHNALQKFGSPGPPHRKAGACWPDTFDPAHTVGPRRSLPNQVARDRKSTRLNSSHVAISYAVFCLKKKKTLCI